MNILPHKSWHVRTKKNIARVRKDEAKAAAEEKETQRRIALAGQEARTALLRERASQRLAVAGDQAAVPLAKVADISSTGHINFFADIESGEKGAGTVSTNPEHEKEKKDEQESYEKKIGYLVYLGQDSAEQTKERPWYAKIERGNKEEVANKSGTSLSEAEMKLNKFKEFHDPLKDIRPFLHSIPPSKSKPATSSNKSTKSDLKEKAKPLERTKLKKLKKKEKKTKKDKKRKKHKKDKKEISSEGSSDYDIEEEDLEKQKKLKRLRAERLEREREERRRAEQHLAKLRGDPIEKSVIEEEKSQTTLSDSKKQKYNSQFNPHLARQNYVD